ncbi:bifunctional hydroxymethylpyrimidine kinase/phosphomethylpyrimidine kinase [Candidatus Micrarchaeota archaeon]|nr:bifunctional hydroxymethylpyrimidine kinase/phosphomethylpyrimidine kinase [Candidatus Micrarchaeota archaeon]MBU2476238.1 bifunctional hydroxymethylpyrimidine kinase/phosphomethylpyrimidine kinase [Candidatus Micrarchaeota archaeon]
MIEVLIVGSIGLDDIETPFGKIINTLGGSAVYSSIASSFFAPTGIVGVIGEDFPKEHMDLIERRRIDTKGIEELEGKTFRWSGKYEFDLNTAQTLKTELNVIENFKPKIPEEYKNAEYVFLGNIDPELQLSVLEQIKNPKLVVSDTMNYWIESKREKVMEVINAVDIALMNDSEARELFKTPNLVKAAKEILKLNSDYAIIKKGEHGAVMFTDNKHFSVPGYPLEDIKDPTGAGDSFAGALTGFLAQTKELNDSNLRKAMVYGSVLASLEVEGLGVTNMDFITQFRIKERFEEFKEIVKF